MASPRTYTDELLANVRRRYEETDEHMASLAADLAMHPRTLQDKVHEWGWTPRNRRPPRDLTPLMRALEESQALAPEHPLGGLMTETDADRSDTGRSNTDGADTDRAKTAGADTDTAATNATSTDAVTGSADPTVAEAERLPPDGASPASAAPASPTQQSLLERIDRLHRAFDQEMSAVERMREQLGRRPQKPVDAERTARTLEMLTRTLNDLERLRFAASPEASDDDDDFPRDLDEFRRELARRMEAFVASRSDGESGAGAADAAGGGTTRD